MVAGLAIAGAAVLIAMAVAFAWSAIGRGKRGGVARWTRVVCAVLCFGLAGVVVWGMCVPSQALRLVPDSVIARAVRWAPAGWCAPSAGASVHPFAARTTAHRMSDECVGVLIESLADVIESRPSDAPAVVELVEEVLWRGRTDWKSGSKLLREWKAVFESRASVRARGTVMVYLTRFDGPRMELTDTLEQMSGFSGEAVRLKIADGRIAPFPELPQTPTLAMWHVRAALATSEETAREKAAWMFTHPEPLFRQAMCEEVLQRPASYAWALAGVCSVARADSDEHVRRVAYEAEKRVGRWKEAAARAGVK